jgi:hypothetical protein
VNHLSLDPTLKGNMTFGYHEAGHQMYVHPPSLKTLKAEGAGFMKDAVPGRANGALKK